MEKEAISRLVYHLSDFYLVLDRSVIARKEILMQPTVPEVCVEAYRIADEP